MIEDVLRYLGWKWWVIPLWWVREDGRCACGKADCLSPGKHPIAALTPNGEKSATNKPEVATSWWGTYPRANVGIATGPSGLTVVDVDGPEGQKRIKEVGPLPRTLVASTGREGGLHLYYAGNEGVSSSQSRKGEQKDHIDVRARTGYVVAPPSNHASGRAYAWLNLLQVPAPLPDNLRQWLKNRKSGKKATTAPVDLGARPAFLPPANVSALGRMSHALNDFPYTPHNYDRLRQALFAIPPDIDGQTWFAIGAALHDLNWQVNGIWILLDLFDEWSSTSQGEGAGNGEYKGREDVAKRWASFGKEYSGPRWTFASIFKLAMENGWTYTPSVSAFPQQEVSGEGGVNGKHVEFLPTQGQPIRFPDMDKTGNLKATCRNARAAIRMLGVETKYDLFHDRLWIGGQALHQWAGELTDNAVHMLRVVIEQQYRLDPGTQHTYDAAVQECLLHSYDPVGDYLDGLTWDGVPRLRGWLSRYMGAEDNPLNQMIGGLSLIAAVRRARQPGAKFDQIVVLIGPEGQGKSRAVEILAGAENFSDQEILTLSEQRQQEAVKGVWLYEIGELAGLSRADVEKVKAFASRTSDRCRPAYGKARVDQPRRCVFFATTNHETFLMSQTGNRRFWPVATGRIDLEGLRRDRDQLWAEAAHHEGKGVSIDLPEAFWGMAREAQEARRDADPLEEILGSIPGRSRDSDQAPRYLTSCGRYYETRIAYRTLLDRLLEVGEKLSPVTAKRIAFLMRRLKWEGPVAMKIGGALVKGYRKRGELVELPVTIE